VLNRRTKIYLVFFDPAIVANNIDRAGEAILGKGKGLLARYLLLPFADWGVCPREHVPAKAEGDRRVGESD